MIPFASQRGGGADLAAHLQNSYDNEFVEVADIRGAMAEDLSGAFAEFEAQAQAMTKCKNFLYSLSINPDPAQGSMPRELYDEYIERVEDTLGLHGQGRAIVYHIKEDKRGELREHCHVVWSRIDVRECKAIHLAFDYDKLMGVTRQFALDHNIQLAPGYHKLEERKRENYRQLSLYEKAQESELGISKEQRMEVITELWEGRDTPASFVSALEYHGYILAQGKRPYVLVDIHGHTNSLPKLIDDRSANTKAIREFLGSEFPEESLPSVDEALEIAKNHLQALKDQERSRQNHEHLDQLRQIHESQREKLEAEQQAKKADHEREKSVQSQRLLFERSALSRQFIDEERRKKVIREASKSVGLSAFLSKASGIELARTNIHKFQDAQAHKAYLQNKRELMQKQNAEKNALARRHDMQRLDQQRKLRALLQTQAKEEKSFKLSLEKQRSIALRGNFEHIPSMNYALTPPGRKAAVSKAANRHTSPIAQEMRKQTVQPQKQEPVNLQDEFSKAAQMENNSRSGGSGQNEPGRYLAKPLKPGRGRGRAR